MICSLNMSLLKPDGSSPVTMLIINMKCDGNSFNFAYVSWRGSSRPPNSNGRADGGRAGGAPGLQPRELARRSQTSPGRYSADAASGSGMVGGATVRPDSATEASVSIGLSILTCILFHCFKLIERRKYQRRSQLLHPCCIMNDMHRLRNRATAATSCVLC